MTKVSFSVSARTAKLIGQENFASAEGAIVELVKNGYDADAKNCIIIFQNHDSFSKHPVLYIIDNGVGMTRKVIQDHWMKIGTDDKLQNYLSADGRVKTGAKGIGRFALDRLGQESEMKTISKEEPIEKSIWKVKWSDFEQVGVAIHQVKADLDPSDELDIKDELKAQFQGFKEIINVLDKTKFDSGTVLKISPLKDDWNVESIKSLFNNLEVLIPPKEQPEFAVHLFSTNQLDDFGEVNSAYYDDFDYKITAKYMADDKNTVSVEITRNELDVKRLEENFGEVFEFDQMKEFPYRLEDFKKENLTISRPLLKLPGFSKVDPELLKQIGKFDFTFYFLKKSLVKKDLVRYPYKSMSQANRKAWLEKFGGVKIFRDDFRVRPYGEDGQDWLDLGKRESRSPGGPGQKMGGYRIGPDQISGTVSISRIANASFQDKSGREGIQENEAFNLFKNIIVEIIAIFERDRNVVMFNLNELEKAKNKVEGDKQKAKEEAEKILSQGENVESDGSEDGQDDSTPDDSDPTERERLFARNTKVLEQEIEEKDEEIRFLRGLASVGLIISSFAHELKSLRTRLSPRTDFLAGELKKYISKEDLNDVNKQENPFFMLQLMKEEDLKLKHWLDYSLSTLKRDKRTRTNVNIGEYFEKFEAIWSNALKQRKVQIVRKGSKDSANVIKAFEVDLDAIFHNLLSNSLTALKERKGDYKKQVTIEWKVVDDYIEILFNDNGVGLAEEYQAEPNRIFEYNESSKRNNKGDKIGTGMGLYIVNLVIDDYNKAKLQLMPAEEGFTIKINLPKRKK
ncbi:sensor histidine kinase [Jiulongibacter sediminis]|uniref:ATP-binding protein n=1 Tax=Jiulongibacter sediminis TaxID=1605367 RepID=A0A0P7C7I7_9BACT|nr:sensor histidine kinase [Jiulongibacter sediminis]KPM49515.1 ATP-binding protein [Jiulongibacter sediminis]TBX26558.1 ATP-binding protein [Jiulongibacter sediminis]